MKGLIFTYVLTYGGAVASIFDPFIGVLIYICFSIVKPESMWYWSVPSGSYSRIVAIALLIGWALRGFGQWQLGKSRGVLLALLGYFCWSGIACVFAVEPDVAWATMEPRAKIVLPFLVALTLLDSLNKLKGRSRLFLRTQ
jgi:hypothetical protein